MNPKNTPDKYSVTPVMQQYLSLKQQYKEYILLYRLGDFYELFFEDAVLISKSLNIVLTKRGKYQDKDIPMCGVPFNTSEYYFHKLISLGYKIAICEQLETPAEAKRRGAKSIVKRDVVRIITPGTIVEDVLLSEKEHNYLACLTKHQEEYGFSWLELSTGNFFCTTTNQNNLYTDLLRISPKEIIISDKLLEIDEILTLLKRQNISITNYSSIFFEYKKNFNILCDFYKISTLKGIDNFNKAEISSCGSLVEYLKITQKGKIPRLQYPQKYLQQNFMFVDASAIKSLELFRTQSGEIKGSLVSAIDYTKTPSGSRILKQYLSSPFSCEKIINRKLDTVEFFIKNQDLRQKIREELENIADMERILSRIILDRASPKDLYKLKLSLDIILKMSQFLYGISSCSINTFYENLGEHGHISELLNNNILENNVNNVKEGNFINSQNNKQLAELLYVQNNSTNLINELRNKYRQLTKISNLKIQYNNLIGYYIETSTNHVINLPNFIHRQSLANSIRYVTPELKELEGKILKAKDSAINLEVDIFNQLCKYISDFSEDIFLAAHTISELDLVTSLAELAIQHRYVRPVIDNSLSFNILKGRHPVIETENKFIANSLNISNEQRLCLITGPNMAGKSTFLRQNALIAILAHIGSFVPAEEAHIGTIDKIFSRVGSSDNITAGYSTFMLEMIETSSVINQATSKSLVILDEVGRGTGLYDGLSLACAIVEHIHNINQCRSIFATHYHELAQLKKYLGRLRCLHMKIAKDNDKIIFLHEVIPGSTDESYGINVARLAGLPYELLERAENLSQKLKYTNKLSLIIENDTTTTV